MQVYPLAATSDEKYMVINMVRGCYWASVLIGATTCFLMLLVAMSLVSKIYNIQVA
ncbi:hypothetical protein BDW72DRAFT_188195 [Aspergillus terricola var. indicus]